MTTQTFPEVETHKTPRLILPNTSLCAIVRDEMMNPAQLPGKSGIRSFVESHVPYVEQAVIVDTGSVDGTRQELEQLAYEFPQLKVHDRLFDDYASARNHSLSLVPTKWSLVLDVDELITQENFGILNQELAEAENFDPKRKLSIPYFFHISIFDVYSFGEFFQGGGHYVRLFHKNRGIFHNEGDKMGEFLYAKSIHGREYEIEPYSPNTVCSKAKILHFYPGKLFSSEELIEKYDATHPRGLKSTNWYKNPERFSESPSEREGFHLWKAPNLHREKFS